MVVSEELLKTLFKKHISTQIYPTTSSVSRFITKVLLILFPEQTKKHYQTIEDLQLAFEKLREELNYILCAMQTHLSENGSVLADKFFEQLPTVHHLLSTDVQAILNGDPAAKSEYEVVRAYPGFYAIAFYRLAHVLHNLNIPLIPRVITEFAHSKSGIDIHPGAIIGEYFYIDHGTGVVIGETAIIGNNVKLYQGITLGALSVSKEMAMTKRHPTIENNVVIYSGATILGGDTVIGHHSIIGGNVWLTQSTSPYSKIYHKEELKIS